MDEPLLHLLGNFLHKRLIHYVRTDFYLFVCARALNKKYHASYVVCLQMAYYQTERSVGERDSYIPKQHRRNTSELHHQTVEVITCGECCIHMHASVYLFQEGHIYILAFLQSVCQL